MEMLGLNLCQHLAPKIYYISTNKPPYFVLSSFITCKSLSCYLLFKCKEKTFFECTAKSRT